MEKSKIKTGIFGGSFNPIHMGHLALANYLCEYNGLDEIWFLVSPHNPLKQQTDLWDDNLRLELVKLAIADYPKFRVRDCVICTKIQKQMAKRNGSLPANCKNFSVLFVFATHTLLVQTQVYEKGVYSQWQATRVLCPRLRKP